ILFSNHAFYDSKLIVSPNVETPKKPPIEYVYAKDGSFINKRNPIEAKEVITLLKKILKEKEPEETIGIITFNSTQRDVISDLIDEELFKGNGYQKLLEKEVYRKSDQEDQSLFVKNIENVQGDERDIIIFSMGYAKDDKGVVKRRFGWLNHEGGQNRLNVAITRAKKKIYFVSSLYPEELKVDDLSGKGPKLLKDFMRYCYYISTGKKELAKEVLLQLSSSESSTKVVIEKRMTEEIKARVEKLGYIVEHDLGIGQFKLDLAIKDPVENKYVLGVICDLDENPSNARLSLLHHEKFLESRGWQTVRIFHSNWYEDQNKELKRIKDKLKSI
ncbi:MAG: AAA domain-containing protein, partial [Paracholeplasma sp.]